MLVVREVNDNYTIKIHSLNPNAHKYSDANAKNEIVKMIVAGEIDRDDVEKICNTYMGIRESMIMSTGDGARWVKK
jgi:hypothetical protein